MKRLVLAAILSAIACTVGFAKSGTFPGFSAPTLPEATEPEKLVSEITGSILNIAAFASRFDPADAFHVRNVARAGAAPKFSVARRGEVFTIAPPKHVWVPSSYVALARSYMADGAGPGITEDMAQDALDVANLMNPDPESLRAQNARLSALLQAHPKSAALHERAALLLSAAARGAGDGDVRVFLCRMTAHLAVSRALHMGPPSRERELAERLLASMAELEQGTTRPARGAEPVWTPASILP